ncbi:PH domain-containing protein [Priestia filamentosa]|uniref:PH domain-containing protein n=1 Tax=Priestia filamentosa TaxID=1402861 RepID=UPI003982593E
MKRVSKKSISVWHLEDSQGILGFALAATVGFYILRDYELVKKAYYVTLLLSGLKLIWELFQNPFLYRHMAYAIQEHSLCITSGAFSINEAVIPFNRIQHIDTEQTFFSRMFKLHRVTIYTAGDSHTISYLPKEEAEALKDKMIEFVANSGVRIDE